MLPAARVGDSIKHENWTDKKVEPPLVIGTSIAIILSGGGVAVLLMVVGPVSVAGAIFDWWMAPSGEKIKTGAATVFTNLKAAALAHRKCKVDHGVVETGAEHVFIEEGNASRLRDLTPCGFISEGSKEPNQVLIGGKSVNRARPGWYTAFLAYKTVVSGASLASSLHALSAGATLGGLASTGLKTGGTVNSGLELESGTSGLQAGKMILDRLMD